MNVSHANTADEMRIEVVAYFDNMIAAHKASERSMPPKTLKDRALFNARARQLEVHREFFASLMLTRSSIADE